MNRGGANAPPLHYSNDLFSYHAVSSLRQPISFRILPSSRPSRSVAFSKLRPTTPKIKQKWIISLLDHCFSDDFRVIDNVSSGRRAVRGFHNHSQTPLLFTNLRLKSQKLSILTVFLNGLDVIALSAADTHAIRHHQRTIRHHSIDTHAIRHIKKWKRQAVRLPSPKDRIAKIDQ